MYSYEDYIIDYGRFIKIYSSVYVDLEEFYLLIRELISESFVRKILKPHKILELSFNISLVLSDIEFDMTESDYNTFKSDLSHFINYVLSELVKNEMFEQASNIDKIKSQICF